MRLSYMSYTYMLVLILFTKMKNKNRSIPPFPVAYSFLPLKQVRAAQKGVPTGQVYAQNEQRLGKVGVATLEKMLYERKWVGLPVYSSSSAMVRAAREEEEKYAKIDVSASTAAAAAAAGGGGGVCPFPHAAASASWSLGSMIGQSVRQAESPAVPATVVHSSTVESVGVQSSNRLSIPRQQAGGELSSLMEKMNRVGGDRSDEDYVKLAEEVEKWMSLQED